MKKIIKCFVLNILLSFFILLISSYDLSKSEDEILDDKVQNLFVLLENKDKERLKIFF